MRRLTIYIGALAALTGCNANSGEQALARLDTETTAEIAATVSTQVEGKLDAALVQIDQRLEDHSARITETTQKAVLAVNKVDNSTSDKVVNRALVIGVVTVLIMLVATYPVGKLLWLIGGRIGNGRAHRARYPDQGSVLRS